jgi:ribosomal protein S18 acetylase RimI-like enzyme
MLIRPYLPDDEEAILTLWNDCLMKDRITPAAFRERTLLEPNFDARRALLAIENDRIAGFVCGMRRATAWWGYSPAPEKGWITTIFVAPAFRRRGIGSRLLQSAMEFLQSEGCVEVRFAHFAPHYYFPGVDQVAYPGALEFFRRHGFAIEEKVVAMGRQLYDLVVPLPVIEQERRLAEEGIRCCYFEPRYLPPALSFFKETFPTWGYYFRRKLQAQPGQEDEMVIVVDRDRVIGYCQQLEAEHIGPFGIHPDFRGRGIGTVMLYRLLRRMQEKEYRFAWFGMTEHAESYYARAGFEPTREHLKLIRRLNA